MDDVIGWLGRSGRRRSAVVLWRAGGAGKQVPMRVTADGER